MNITEYQNKKSEYGIEGTGIDVTTKVDRTWKDKITGFTIPAGSKVHIDFSPRKFSNRIFITYNGEVKVSRIELAYKWLPKFTKPPTIRTLEKRSNDGISRSVLGEKVEPDGYGPTGAPSWELVLGII